MKLSPLGSTYCRGLFKQYEYLLPFEAASVLLLACIIGSIAIATKSKEVNK